MNMHPSRMENKAPVNSVDANSLLLTLFLTLGPSTAVFYSHQKLQEALVRRDHRDAVLLDANRNYSANTK